MVVFLKDSEFRMLLWTVDEFERDVGRAFAGLKRALRTIHVNNGGFDDKEK